MRQLNGVYAQSFNRRHARVGHLFQGRYRARVVQADAHLLSAVRYILRNPVRAGLCHDPGEWRWSSHREALGASRAGSSTVCSFSRTSANLARAGASAIAGRSNTGLAGSFAAAISVYVTGCATSFGVWVGADTPPDCSIVMATTAPGLIDTDRGTIVSAPANTAAEEGALAFGLMTHAW